jgi:hypothetical protein
MSDSILKEILEGINNLKQRMSRLEWLLMEVRFSEVEPTPEELEIIKQYEKEKEKGEVEFSKLV